MTQGWSAVLAGECARDAGRPFTQSASVARPGDNPIPVLNLSLWSFWIPWFLGLIIAEICFAVWKYKKDWTPAVAIINLCLAFVITAVIFWAQARAINLVLVEAAPCDLNLSISGGCLVGTIVIATWDITDGFLKTYRGERP